MQIFYKIPATFVGLVYSPYFCSARIRKLLIDTKRLKSYGREYINEE